jgi:hypothetical protein
VIVDEAHQNYFADTIQSRISVVKHQVLLTATPSKFIADGSFDILAVARLDIPNEYYARLNFQIINADNKLDKDDYNKDGVVKTTTNFTIKEMKSAVDAVFPHIKDGKKLFICRDIKHANVTAKYLTTLGVESFVSDSKSDADGSIADSFKSGQIQSLVVVDRMRLGYSDNNLYYTVDLSFTHNADTIHQMMSRSNRGVQLQNKFYIKVTNDRLNVLTRVIVSASIALMKRENLLAYNGKNFKGVQIPVVHKTSSSKSSKKICSASSITIPDFGDVQNFFDDCDFVDGDDILVQLGFKKAFNYHNYEEVSDVASKYDSFTSFSKENHNLYQYLLTTGQLDNFLAEKGWSKRTNKTKVTNEEIFAAAKNYDKAFDFQKGDRKLYNLSQTRKIVKQLIYKSGLTTDEMRAISKAGADERRRASNRITARAYYHKKRTSIK